MDYFGARYLSGAQGRWSSVDPTQASAIALNPQTWNRYAYVYNNPLRVTDPDGACPPCLEVAGEIAERALIGGAINATVAAIGDAAFQEGGLGGLGGLGQPE